MIPEDIQYHKRSRELTLAYSSTESYNLSAELLRVLSPSAEVRGHGPSQAVLQHGKASVAILNIEPTGNYALRFTFDDGHDSGIYTWEYLYELATEQDALWEKYLQELESAGKSREPKR